MQLDQPHEREAEPQAALRPREPCRPLVKSALVVLIDSPTTVTGFGRLDGPWTGPASKTVADTWFFETVVRVHRAGEGAPFTGLAPAGVDLACRARRRQGAANGRPPV